MLARCSGRCLLDSARCMSSAAPVISEMIAFVRSATARAPRPSRPPRRYQPVQRKNDSREFHWGQTAQENMQQALDVIQQGLAMQADPDAGYDATRWVTMARVTSNADEIVHQQAASGVATGAGCTSPERTSSTTAASGCVRPPSSDLLPWVQGSHFAHMQQQRSHNIMARVSLCLCLHDSSLLQRQSLSRPRQLWGLRPL